MPIQPKELSKHLSGYEPTERIGAGGYGEVWKSTAPGGLLKAVKFVYGFLDDVRAAGELKSLNRIREVRHPFLLSLERIEIVDGQLVIITELADACLKDRYEECRKTNVPGIPREELLVYLGDAADALDYMREKFSLQHLDVKPENLLLVGGRVKVGDFGLVKELSDVTASLLGGLTPVYAPPELFDGRPSVHSDQYSLAIVYQEMLTGTLPFPGRTTAQLAAQHLNAIPRLGGLSSGDQEVLRRALSKNPNDRFASCREMVNRLVEMDRAPSSAPWPGSADPLRGRATSNVQGGADSRGQRLSALVRDFQSKWSKPLNEPAPSQDGNAATEYFSPDAGPADPPPDSTTSVEIETRVRDLPPFDAPFAEETFRPTLFLGIGNAAGEVLVRVRRQLTDRFGDLDAVPSLQTLLLDTDRKSLLDKSVTQRGIPQGDTLALPLRRSTEYRDDSKKFLKWLSRRWLFNIPRSLLTEGRRPLGRLALVDHNREFFERLVKAITTMCGEEALAVSREAIGGKWQGNSPRVYIVAATGGGTGGGMALDIGYAVRFVLEELGLPTSGVCGVLFHASDRHPEAAELAAVNSFALLSEWNDYARPGGGYPGDPALGLPAFPEVPPFSRGYFLHLGNEMQEGELSQALDRVAKYLFCDAATPASGLLAACRESVSPAESAAADVPSRPATHAELRTFGTHSVGAMQSALPDAATRLLARSVLLRWSGDFDAVAELRLLSRRDSSAAASSANSRSQVAAAFEQFVAKLDLNLPSLNKRLEKAAAGVLGDAPEDRFRQLHAQSQALRGASLTTDDNASLRCLDELFGQADVDRPDGAGTVGTALVRQAANAADKQAETFRAWLTSLVDAEQAGIGGAQHAAALLVERMSELEKQAAEERRSIGPRLRELELLARKLAAGERLNARDFKGTGPKGEPTAGDLAAAYGRLRLGESMTRAVERFSTATIKLLGGLIDDLKSAQRLMQELLREFPAPAAGKAALEGQDLTIIQKAIAAAVDARLSHLSASLRPEFSTAYFGEGKLLLDGLREGVETRALCKCLSKQARIRVLSLLQETDVVSAILAAGQGGDSSADASERRLQEYLKAAKPKALECGGARRLLLMLPREADHARLKEAIESGLAEKASVALGVAGEAVFCYEAEQVPLPRLAASLIEYRRDLAEAAARLHARLDVPWSQLMTC